jgi:hypothetical protein
MRGIALVAVAALLPVLSQAQTPPAAPAPEAQAAQPAAQPAAPPPPPPGEPPPAPPRPVQSTAHRHLGFFLRLDIGLGYLNSSATQGGVDASMGGFAMPLGIAIGGAVAENVILAADLWGSLAFSPTLKLGSSSANPSDTSFSLSGLGLNFTYYFMPANVYVSVSPSMTFVSLTSQNVTTDTEIGFGAKVGIGKEWWVGDHWGLGVAGQFFLGINNDQGGSPTWTSLGGALAFTATYN